LKYFDKLNFKCQISDKLLSYAKTATYQPYFNFMAAQVPKEMLKDELMVQALSGKWQAGILRMDANTCYNWHTDTNRKVSINMLLNYDNDSHCVFGECNSVQFPITELKYEPDTYYLLDTTKPHMVLNLDKPRYMFSIEFL
jgi:hypothetical protein